MPAAVPVPRLPRPEPDPARSWLEDELRRPEYRQSLLDRLLSWLGDLWDSLQAAALGASSLSTGAAVLVLVVLTALLVLVAGRVRQESRGGVGTGSALDGGPVTPEEHRARAEAALSRGSHDTAVVEGCRAVAARAVQTGAIEHRPGRTARELAGELGPLFPDHSAGLHRASMLFDSVFYGGQPATPADARLVLDLDDAVRTTRPAAAPLHPPGATSAVRR